MPAPNFDVIASLAKRRGFVFPSSEIYGGMAGFWDYGPLGVELKNNIKAAWWRHMVTLRDDVVGIDAAIIMSPRVWEASGHVAGFSDPMVDCRNCKHRFRETISRARRPRFRAHTVATAARCTEARQFNLMFATHVGPVAELRIGRVSAPRDGAGHVRPVRQRGDHDAPQAAVRNRPDGPILPQRDHAGQLHLPPARVRADGDGVLRPSVDRGRVVRTLGGHPPPLVDRCAGHRPRAPAPAPARRRRAVALLDADHRHRVRVPDRLVRAGGGRRSHRLRPAGAYRGVGQEARDLRRGDRRARRAVRRSSRPWASTAPC